MPPQSTAAAIRLAIIGLQSSDGQRRRLVARYPEKIPFSLIEHVNDLPRNSLHEEGWAVWRGLVWKTLHVDGYQQLSYKRRRSGRRRNTPLTVVINGSQLFWSILIYILLLPLCLLILHLCSMAHRNHRIGSHALPLRTRRSH